MRYIDLRSDTVTHPTPAMREAMYRAEVGDDVFGDDPTVNRLQEMAAERVGKEAGLFVPSGTMGNLLALLTHCGRGTEVILGDMSHTYLAEVGGVAAVGGINPRPLPNRPDGTIAPAQIEAAIRPDNVHYPRTRLICLENTQNYCGGAVLPPHYMSTVGQIARRYDLPVHLDGARIFNAAVALGVPAGRLAQDVTSVQFCFSKGLAAPIGSILCGPADFIAEARRNRKMVGGGMRQVGVIAAACIVALEQMIDRLAEDHANARRLADGLAQIPGIRLDPSRVQTNIVFFDVAAPGLNPEQFLAGLRDEGVLVVGTAGRLRAVTHSGVGRADIDAALGAFARTMRVAA